jgi:antitoxin HicB
MERGRIMSEAVLKLHIESLKKGGYLATSDALPGLVAQGRTIGETLEIAQDVARKLVESYVQHKDKLPIGLKEVQKKGLDINIPVGLP